MFLGDARPRHVGAGVEDPDFFRGSALLKEDDVRLHAGVVGREGSPGKAQDRVQVAALPGDFKDLARLWSYRSGEGYGCLDGQVR